MKIGDIEYTRHFRVITNTVQESEFQELSFALGIQVRPLLTRISSFFVTAQAITGGMSAFIENGSGLGDTLSRATLVQDPRAHMFHDQDFALSTNGMGITFPHESEWWKVLLPDVRIHLVATTLAIAEVTGDLHYRFAELTSDEIIEIAAQRAQA